MPELPEVETTRRGLVPLLVGQRIEGAVVRNRSLRWPIPNGLSRTLSGQRVLSVERRAKYLLIKCEHGTLIVHLGMSGSLRMVPNDMAPRAHDHFDLLIGNGAIVRLTDPRRFGAVLWTTVNVLQHKLLARLGPEPLSDDFDNAALYAATRGRSVSIKLAIMDSRIVVGVGNIYASEALFRAGINPKISAGKLSLTRCARLVIAIKETLTAAINSGGSTLRDFFHTDGSAGKFQLKIWVYDRAGEPCKICGTHIRAIRQGQRSTFYCPKCQH